MSRVLRAAIVGLGTISFEHIEKLREVDDARIAGICDLDPLVVEAVSVVPPTPIRSVISIRVVSITAISSLLRFIRKAWLGTSGE